MKQIFLKLIIFSIAVSGLSCAVLIKENEKNKEAAINVKNASAGDLFLQGNRSNPGIKTTPSGLQYKVLTEGNGPKPKATDIVKVHYRGTLTNGTEFDSSYKRNEPSVFPLNKVIPGWTEGLQLMNTGSKYIFYIPASLAYGERSIGDLIPGNSTLIFEVELLGIE